LEYRTLGNTGLRVSVLGFGASPLGGAFGPIDETEGIRAVHAALDLGVNFFDTAPLYGKTRSEIVLGQALRGIDRDRYYLSTKVGRYDTAEFDFSAGRVTRSVEESLQRLGVDYIDIIHCHDIEFVDLNQVIDEALPALRKVQEQGKVHFLSVSGYPLKIFRSVMDRACLDVILSYCHYSLNNISLAAFLLPYLKEKGVGVISAAPLSMGLLTDAGPPPWHPAPDNLKSACAAAARACSDLGLSIADLALRYSLVEEGISTTLVGMGDVETVKRNVAAVGRAPDEEALKQVWRALGDLDGLEWKTGRDENR
jgi:L-galactose dehydrogenase